MKKKCDVLVVGAGPAGSGAAAAAADQGANTLMIDKKSEIGTPVRCGEVIGKSLLDAADIEVPSRAVCHRQDHTRFILNRKVAISNYSPYWQSITVERKIFDKYLAQEAAESGASVQANTKLLSLEGREDVKSVRLSHRGEQAEVSPQVVVAADGVHSTVARKMGVKHFTDDMVARGVEFEMVAERELPAAMQIFLEPEVGLGYGWIIPKGERRANVGMGRVGPFPNRQRTLHSWVSAHPVVSQYFDADKILEVKMGEAPVPGFKGGLRKGNVLFAGDAAGQTLAFVGEGIMPSYSCGSIAGSVAAAACGEKDLNLLDNYDIVLRDLMGEEMEMGASLKDMIVGIWRRRDLPTGSKTALCGLLMSECIGSDVEDYGEYATLDARLSVRGLERLLGDAPEGISIEKVQS